MKKIFSFLTLAAAVLCSGNAWAGNVAKIGTTEYATLQAAFNAASSGATIVLIDDIAPNIQDLSYSDLFTVEKNATLNLNGHSIITTGSASYTTLFRVESGIEFTVIGKGELSITSGSRGYSFTLNNGKVTLSPTKTDELLINAYYIIDGQGTKDIRGGSFNKTVASFIDANNYEVRSENGRYVVYPLSYICTVNGVSYKTIKQAMDSAKKGNPWYPIVLTDNATYTASSSAGITEDFTFNSSDHTLTVNYSYYREMKSAYIYAGTYNCKVNAVPLGGYFNNTVTGNAQGGIYNSTALPSSLPAKYVSVQRDKLYCVAKETNTNDNGIIAGKYYVDISNFVASNYTCLENSSLAVTKGRYFVAPDSCIDNNNKIFAGAYIDDPSSFKSSDYSVASSVYDNNNVSHYIVGKNIKTTKYKVTEGTFKADPTPFVNTSDFNVTYDKSSKEFSVSLKKGAGYYAIGETEYYSLKDAIAAVPTDGTETIIMVKKVATESSYSTIDANQNIVLDLNNKSISYTGGHLLYNYGALKVKDSSNEKQGYLLSSNMTIKGYTGSTTIIDSCTIIGQGNGTADGGVTIDAGASLTVNGGVLKSPSAGRRALSSSGTTVINNGEIICESTSNTTKNQTTAIRIANGTTTINNATITSTSTSYATLLISGGTVTIKNATVTGASATYATSITGGNTTINNITVSGKMTGTMWKAKGGTFSVNPKNSNSNCCMKGYAVTETITGEQWKIEPKTCLIQGSESEYGSVLVNGKSSDQVKAGYTVNISVNMTNPDYKVSYYLVNDSIIEGNSFEVDDNAEVTAEFVPKVYVCQIGTDGAKFETLYEASQAVLANQTINLLKDYTTSDDGDYINIGKENVVVDLNGYTITLPNQSQLTVDGRPTLKNGSITGNHNYLVVTIQYNPTVEIAVSSTPIFEDLKMNGGFNLRYTDATFKNCNVDASGKAHYAIYLDNTSGTCNTIVHSGFYTGKSTALYPSAGTTFTLYGGCYNSAPNSDWLAADTFSIVNSGLTKYPYAVVNNVIAEPTVELKADTTIQSGAKVAAEKVKVEENATLTITNGASLLASEDIVVKEKATITVADGATLTTPVLALAATPANIDLEQDQAGTSSQIAGEGAVQAQDAYIDITMNNSGTMNSKRYYAFAVPFNVAIVGGVEKVIGSTTSPATRGTDYRVYEYDGGQRATKGEGANWKKVGDATDGGYFIPGKFYLAEFADNSCNVFRFHKATDAKLNNIGNVTLDLNTSQTGEAGDGGWNGIANNALSNASVSVNDVQYAQVLKETGDGFYGVELNSTYFAISTPMFIKTTGATEAVVAKPSSSNAPARMLAQTNDKALGNYTVRIKADGATKMADQMFISANENATNAYTDGKDLAKMFLGTSSTAQLWVNNYGMKLTANQAVLTNDVAEASITLYAPTAGNYTVYLRNIADDADIYLLNNGQAVANLNNGAFTVTLAKGENAQYGIRINAKTIPGVFTSIDEALVGGTEAKKVLLNGNVYIIRDGKMFNTLGQQR